ncbi:MAG: hypothetical protein LC687_06630 [Actinobacteria bacterium]|nr:hypothetical protein [Actinomycetota bacterium]
MAYQLIKSEDLLDHLKKMIEIPENAHRVVVTLETGDLPRVECDYYPMSVEDQVLGPLYLSEQKELDFGDERANDFYDDKDLGDPNPFNGLLPGDYVDVSDVNECTFDMLVKAFVQAGGWINAGGPSVYERISQDPFYLVYDKLDKEVWTMYKVSDYDGAERELTACDVLKTIGF